MEQKLQKLFKQAKYLPESRLSGDIWRVIDNIEKRNLKFKSWGYSFAGVFSLVFIVPVVRNLIEQFIQSCFYDYLSLVFSDLGSISLYWKEFMYSLIEAIPAVSLTITLLLSFVLLISLKRAIFSFRSQLLTT